MGPAWLTQALRAAGTISDRVTVTKIDLKVRQKSFFFLLFLSLFPFYFFNPFDAQLMGMVNAVIKSHCHAINAVMLTCFLPYSFIQPDSRRCRLAVGVGIYRDQLQGQAFQTARIVSLVRPGSGRRNPADHCSCKVCTNGAESQGE